MEIYNMYGPHFITPDFRPRPIRSQNMPTQHLTVTSVEWRWVRNC